MKNLVNAYWIVKHPTTWRVYVGLPFASDRKTTGRPLTYRRCESLAQVRAEVRALRANGLRCREDHRYEHPSVRDARELKRLSDAIGEWDGRPRLDEFVRAVVRELRRLPLIEDDDDATEGWCQVSAARSIASLILRELNCDGWGGCRLCCS